MFGSCPIATNTPSTGRTDSSPVCVSRSCNDSTEPFPWTSATTAFTRNAGLRFRIQSLHARYLSYERMWLRSAREKEDGTYRRDLFKARLHAKEAAIGMPGAPARQPRRAARSSLG